jgi:hypothetical protein
VPQYELSLTLPAGTHTIAVRATDAAAQPLTSAPTQSQITVQRQPAPLISYTKTEPLVSWRIALFDRGGRGLGIIDDCQQPKLTFVLNGIDTFGCALPLNHRRASAVLSAASFVKVWRAAKGQVVDARYPSFAGIVLPVTEGSGNVFNLTAFSPLQMLQARYVWELLKYEDDKGRATIDQSEILRQLLAYTNARGNTGIAWGTSPATANRPRRYDIGQNIWEAYSDIITTLGGVDLIPTYLHTEGSAALMTLSTSTARGGFRQNARVDYYVGLNNAADSTRQFTAEPGTFANFVGLRGQGDTPVTAESFDDASIGVYGLWERFETVDSANTFDYLKALSDALLRQSKQPLETVQPVIGIGLSPIYGRDYEVGDVITTAARRGRMVYDRYQRVYQAELLRTDTLQEQVTLQVADDFDSVVPGVPA